jgi:hypothetical protein
VRFWMLDGLAKRLPPPPPPCELEIELILAPATEDCVLSMFCYCCLVAECVGKTSSWEG